MDKHALQQTVEHLEARRVGGDHPGWQLFVSLGGDVIADLVGGEARAGQEMARDTILMWFSSTKIVPAIAAAQLWEKGAFALDDAVAAFIPEFGSKGKEAITIRHLLTHTAGIRYVDMRLPDGDIDRVGPFVAPWEERLARSCDGEIEDGWIPGQRAGYHPFVGMTLLAEIVRRVDGRPFSTYVREAIFEPLGMVDSWVGMPADRCRAYGDRLGKMHVTELPTTIEMPIVDDEAACIACVPGGGGRGPARELARLYEMLAGLGERDGVRILAPQTVEAMTARHRAGMFDETLNAVADWGLGVLIDFVSFGRHCSRRTFGHGGVQSSCSFVDPEHGLVVSVIMNGLPGDVRHYERLKLMSEAIYEDLGLADPSSPGREHPMPVVAFT